MNEYQKILIAVLTQMGVPDEQIKEYTKEGTTNEGFKAYLPALSQASRSRWEGILSQDGKWTEQFTSKGQGAGKAIAFKQIKKQIADSLGINLDETTDNFVKNDLFVELLAQKFTDAKASGKKDDKLEEKLEALRVELSKKHKDRLTTALAELEQSKDAEMTTLRRNINLDAFITRQIVAKAEKMKAEGKKLSIPVEDALMLIRGKVKNKYKVKYGDDNSVNTYTDQDGHQIDNEAKDGKLGADVLTSSFLGNYFIDSGDPKPRINPIIGDPKNPVKTTLSADKEAAEIKAMIEERR